MRDVISAMVKNRKWFKKYAFKEKKLFKYAVKIFYIAMFSATLHMILNNIISVKNVQFIKSSTNTQYILTGKNSE